MRDAETAVLARLERVTDRWNVCTGPGQAAKSRETAHAALPAVLIVCLVNGAIGAAGKNRCDCACGIHSCSYHRSHGQTCIPARIAYHLTITAPAHTLSVRIQRTGRVADAAVIEIRECIDALIFAGTDLRIRVVRAHRLACVVGGPRLADEESLALDVAGSAIRIAGQRWIAVRAYADAVLAELALCACMAARTAVVVVGGV